jgi:hypothetical protein
MTLGDLKGAEMRTYVYALIIVSHVSINGVDNVESEIQ